MTLLFQRPDGGSDEPLEPGAACHDRMRSSLELLQRLVAHLCEHGADEPARAAARDVLRYFNVSAPRHHEDEERHVFPLLRETGDAALIDAAGQLHEDHAAMAVTWTRLEPLLDAVASGAFDGNTGELVASASEFGALYDSHLALEDGTVFSVAARAANS